MKRRLLLLICVLQCLIVKSQSLYQCRYWFDQDPVQTVTVAFNGNMAQMELDAGALSEGVHLLSLQVKDTTGVWCATQSSLFCKLPELNPVNVTYHCWFDQNFEQEQTGSFGNGQFLLDAEGLACGLHTLSVVLEGDGLSSAYSYLFYKAPEQINSANIDNVTYHCWFDEDFALEQTGSFGTGQFLLDAEDLACGLHTLNVALEGAGLSSTQCYLFCKTPEQFNPANQDNVTYHCWYDQDFEHEQTGSFGTGIIQLNTRLLGEGEHTVYILLESEALTTTQSYTFEKHLVDGHIIITMANPMGAGVLDGEGWYEHGDTCILIATANQSYVFENWTNEGNVVSESTTYSFIVTEDSTFVANFIELIVLDTTIYAEICHGEDYIENGFEIIQPEVGISNYSLVFHPAFNYDSIVNLALTVHPNYYIVEDTSFCEMTSFYWHGNTYTESGLYFDTLQTIHGCDSIRALSLEFFNTPLGEFTYMSPTINYPFTSLPITFSWDAVSGAEYYDLYVWDEDEPMPNVPFVSNLTGRNFSTTALLNYHTYNWFVTARNACYETSSAVKSFYLDIEPSLSVNLNQIDFGEVTFNQSVSTTMSVTGVVLEDSLNVQITGEDAAMFSFTKASGWDDYTGGILIVTFHPTVPQYSYNANLVISSGTLTATTSLTGGLADMFVFNTYVADDVYAMNSPIPIYGSLTDVNSTPVANAEVEIGVFVMGMKRTLQAVTDESGQFSAVFEPMPSESGYYTVNSGRVGNHSTAVHDDFNIPGMTLVSSDYILCAVTQDQPRTDSILIRNKSNLSLSNIQVSPISMPDGASFSFMPLSLNGLEENWLIYTVNGSTLTQGNYYEEAKLKATSSEGAEMNLSIWYYCMEPRGVLDVIPKSLATTMTKGKSKIVDVMLTNNGTAATGNITIDLPDVEWMSVVGNDTLSSNAVNDTAYFSLRFSPAEDIQLGQYSGTIAINSERGDAVALPYTITAVSDSMGTLMIDVTDDFTWNTNNGNGPHLEGAEVTLKGYYSLETVAYGFTDSDGHFSVEDLPEGYYRLSVTAERHTDYNSVVFVEAGATGRSYTDVYLQYQAVTYSWTVEPTEILDEYNYELNVVFETNVPVPVVVIEAPDKLPAFDESYTFNYVVTNHGLINAENLKLHVPISNDFLFTPLFEQVDTLHALTTIVVPCVVTYKDNGAKPLRGDCAEWGYTWTEYTYKCLKIDGTLEVNTKSGFVYTLLGNKPCEPPTEIEGNGGNGFNAPLLGIVGGHGFPNPFFTSPLLEMWYECDNGCVNMVFWGIDKLLSNIPVAKWIYTGAKVVYNVATIMDQDVKDALISVYDFYKYVANMANAMSKDVPPMVKYMKMAKEVKTVKQNIIHCYHYLNGTATKDYELELDYSEVPNEIGEMLQYMDEYASAATNMVDILNMYYSDTTWFYSDINELDDFMNMVFEYDSIYGRVYVDSILLSHKPSNINNDQVTSFVDRYNNTVDIYNGVVINSDNYIPIDSINSKLLSIINIEHEALLLGFESSEERMMHLINEAYDYLEENKSLSVCAKVTVQFSQKMTMTREAFDGTLTIHNGHDTDPMEAIDVNFIIKDEEGNNCTNLFQINTMSLNNITGIDGSGSLGAGLDGIAKIQFIPTKYAAPTEPKVYYFGGTFSFIDPYTLDEIVYDLYPVEITVNPSPDLYVDYFMQRDILGDDALTLDVVEPSVPAELGVIINNKGAGMAKNVLLETAEPQIIDNEKGLAIDFAMYGASFNGSPRQLGLMEIPFGNIESGQTAVGEWLFTSSLLGHFVSYTAHVIHNSSYGNPNLSLVSHLDIHELIHPIYAYGNLDDGINDFLVNDNPDAYDTPDSIYFSHGGRTAVGIVETISFNHYVEPQDTIVILTINPSRIGWNYGVTDDPGRDKYELVSCTRNFDNQIIPLSNVWQSFVTIPDGGDPVYENKLHIVDTLSNDVPDFTYTLVYQMKNDLLAVEEILGIPESYIEYPLESINVKFSKPIIDSTFSYEDMTLKCNNGANLMDSTVVVAKISDSLYSVNISNVTNETGLYVLTVNTSNIKDTKGYDGYLGKQASWVQLLNTGVMQTIPLSMGWNWFSSYLTYNDYSLLNFEEQISEVGATGLIKSQNSFTAGNESGFWAGSLNVLDNTQMYMILVNQGLTLTMSGAFVTPSLFPITLRPGWNWIAYLSDNGMSLTEAMTNYSPAHYDIIKSQNQFSTYYEGMGWMGSLNALEPGEGYMYMSNQAEVTSFIYPTPNKEFLGITPIKTFWNTDSHRFQGNMTMMVTLDADQFIMGDGSHEIGAFVNGDCRGSARLQYVDGLNRYVAFLTVGGLEGEEVTFKVYEVKPATAVEGVAEERVTFMANNVIGTLDNPLTLHFGQTGLTEDDGLSQGNRVKIFPNPTNDKVTVLGDGIRSIKISNALGQVVLHKEYGLIKQVELSMSQVGVGVYTLIINTAYGTHTTKLVVTE